MTRTVGKKYIELRFDGVEEVMSYIKSNAHLKANYSGSQEIEYDRDFSGVKDWAEFEQYMKDGNPKLIAQIKRDTKKYADKYTQEIPHIDWHFDTTGQFFDIGAVMNGEPEAWLNEIRIVEEKFITLQIATNYSWEIDRKDMFKNATKFLGIVATLEESGYLVEVISVLKSTDVYKNGMGFDFAMNVKKFNQPMDFKKLAAVIDTPFFRRGGLRLMEIEAAKEGFPITGGYGTSEYDVELRLADIKSIDKLEERLQS